MAQATKEVKKVFVPTSENEVFAKSTVQLLDALCTKRKAWESTDYKKANDGLYALLADSYDVFKTKFLKGSEGDKRTLRMSLESRLKSAGVKVQRNSTTLTMFIRYVFNCDRNRSHGYTYVLKAAISHNVAPANLPTWIASEGGIEEVKRKMVQSKESKANKAKLESAKTQVTAELQQATTTPIAQFHLDGLTGSYALLLAKPQPNGMVSIVGTLSELDEVLYNAMLMRMAKRKCASNDQTSILSKETDDLLGHSPLLSANDNIVVNAA